MHLLLYIYILKSGTSKGYKKNLYTHCPCGVILLVLQL